MKNVVIMPKTEKILKQMGEQIKLCRLRRNISVDLMCQRSGMSRSTYWMIEKGSPRVAMGSYAAALNALNGKDEDLLLICKEDELGRFIQDNNLLVKKRIKN